MSPRLIVRLILLAVVAASPCVSLAEDLGVSAGYLQQLRQQAQFRIVAGELTVSSPQRNGQWESRTTGSGNDERLAFNTTGPHPSIQYERRTPVGEFRLTCEQGSELTIQRSPVGTSTVVPLEFKQFADGGVSLTVTPAEGKLAFSSPTLWHLLLAEPIACRRHLLPVLVPLRDRWELEKQATDIEQALFRAIAERKASSDAVWAQLVADMANESYAVRAAADRRLREAGQNALPFLQALDRNRLDAEQRQRVRAIVATLCGDGVDDHPERVATRLASDVRVWAAMLDRDDASKRKAAADRLSELAGRRIAFDPDAAPEVRHAQAEALKREFGRFERKK